MAKKSRSEESQTNLSKLGKTAKTTIQISSDDGAVFPADVYTAINATDDPDLRAALIEGRLNEIDSPVEKDRVYRPAVPVTYHDPDKNLFALIIPEALRHQEFRCRQELLEQLADHDDILPAYIRRFDIVFGAAELQRLEQRGESDAAAAPQEATKITERPAGANADLEASLAKKDQRIDDLQQELEEARRDFGEVRIGLEKKLAEKEAQIATSETTDGDNEELQSLKAERKQLEVDREQLEEVAARVERDSARVDEARTELQNERADVESLRKELEEQRRKVQVKELNLEQEHLRLKQESEASFGSDYKPHADEATQVVTDDQFIEVVRAEDIDSEVEAEAFSDPDIATDAGPRRRPEPATETLVPYDSEEIFASFSNAADTDQRYFVDTNGGLVVAGFRIDDVRARAFENGELRFLFQLHHVDDVPVIALTLAVFDEDGECVDAVAASLTDDDERQRGLLDQFAIDLHLHLAVYGEAGPRIASWEAGAPIRRNIGWARGRLRQWREDGGDAETARAAAEKVAAGDVELVGSMRHPFESQGFVDFDGASDVQLAVSIVGYWSQPEQVDYLIGNRSFPLETFRQVQKRIVRQALHWGIGPGDALREVALDEAIILDNVSFTQRLLSNFAEVCVGLRPNDLDPLEQWENWDALIQLAQTHGVTPDPDVLELAEVSLKRAEEYEATMEEDDDAGDSASASLGAVDLDELIVSRTADEGGVTYFVATGTDDDVFDEMMSADRDELSKALESPDRRLDAAQALIERFGADVVAEVLEAAEAMSTPELAALARFVEARADGLEAALMQSLDSSGPSATFVVARALATIGSTAALPRLLDAVRDPKRRGSRRALASCLAVFGDKLVPPLSRALKDEPNDDDLIAVLAALEDVRQGTLAEFAKDRSKGLQQAASRVREMG